MRFDLMSNEKWYCYSDDESPLHEESLKGLLHKFDDGFWRFQSHPDVTLTCKDCRIIAEKLSELNNWLASSAGERVMEEQGDGFIGVKRGIGYLRMSDFGVTFDGVTNDYEALMSAIKMAKNEQMLLTLPDGRAVKLW